MTDPATLQREFDEVARALEAGGRADTLQPPERALLGYLPASCGDVLEVGCGDGAITRQVAQRARSVLAVDLSPEMIRLARSRSARQPDIEYRVSDITTMELPVAAFDMIVSVAALHHMPLAPTVRRLAAAVRPGGLLLIQDLLTRRGLRHVPTNAVAWLARRVRGAHSCNVNASAGTIAALYREHGRGESYLTPAEAMRVYSELLPGSRVVHHLEWRYTAIWQRVET